MRQRILEAATDLLTSRGIGSVNFNTLAFKLKTNRAHIRYYFESPSVIIKASFSRLFEAGQETTEIYLAESCSIEEKIRAYVRGAFSWYSSDKQRMTLMLLFLFQTRLDETLRKMHTEYRSTGLRRIIGILKDLHPKKEASLRGRIIQDLITGSILSLATADLAHLKQIQRETENYAIVIATSPRGR